MSATEIRERQILDADAPEIEQLARDAIAASALYGAANVVMQLAVLPVGRGVAESTVDSGRRAGRARGRSRASLTGGAAGREPPGRPGSREGGPRGRG